MFRVQWDQTALNERVTIWMAADSALRQRITACSHAIEQELRINPQEKGESRPEGERIIFPFPLGLLYEIDTEAFVVRVMHVWDIRRKR